MAATGPMICPHCGSRMNQHAEKLVHPLTADEPGIDPILGGVVEELHACPRCGAGAARRASPGAGSGRSS